MKPAYFGPCLYCPNIDKNNYPEETELDTNPSLTLARKLILSTGGRSFGHFTPSRCYDTTLFDFAYMNSIKKIWGGVQNLDQKSLWKKLQLHEIDA